MVNAGRSSGAFAGILWANIVINHTTSRGAGIVARRSTLLLSAAALALGSATAAQAEDGSDFAPVLEAQDGHVSIAAPDPQIVIANPGTPTTARDPDGQINGVGQMIVDEQNGFIGLCTASLINPRTVIFASHCVNERAANAYGAASGGQPIGFGFDSNNNRAGASAFGQWLSTYATNTSRFMYNSNYVAYNARSLEPGNGFLYADVAVAALDTPAVGIPTWALMFSPLPAQNEGADGTGYHVKITGYGNNGNATTGSTGGIDFRRRSAENMLGALASLDTFESFLFGSPNGLEQNLYWIDFDDPRRGQSGASAFDFNAWRDNAFANEGITASGDSGGPLILDQQYNMDVIIGVLSGGYTRFFNGQPANGYGTASFYQPLYLYWDWFAQNNPYHYVGAKAGDGNWTDPTHWQTNLDPAYMVLDADGNLVNGIPTTPGGTDVDTSGAFGTACFQSGGISDCVDVATGTETVEAKPIGTAGDGAGSVQSLPTQVAAGTLSGDQLEDDAAHVAVTSVSAQAGQSPQVVAVLPPATLGNGLPGASGFVPNNDDGDAPNSVAPRYFDVTLSATGTTTLDSSATVDRFAISGAGAALDITAAGSLTSLIDVNQYQGLLRVNGALHTPGDYMLMFGGLQGSGHIYTPFFTNVAGVIAPGGIGTVGTLTFHGDVVLASGSSYLVDIGANGTSDKIAVAATAYDADDVPLDGMASLGGTVLVGATSGAMVRDGYTYTIFTAEGGLTGTFSTPQSLSAILRPTLSYTTNAVNLTIEAGSYLDVVNPNSPVQVAYAQLLDANRDGGGDFGALYGPLDLQDQATIQATLEGLAPRVQTLGAAMGVAGVDVLAQFNRDRLTRYDPSSGGTVAMIGSPLQMAARTATPMDASGSEGVVEDGGLPDNMSLYLAAGYVDGNSAPMTGTTGRNPFDGWYGAVGLELDLGSGMLGLSGGYADLSGNVRGLPQWAKSKLWQASAYWKMQAPAGLSLDGLIGVGEVSTTTNRTVGFVGTNYTLRADDNAVVLNGEVGLSKTFGSGSSVRVTPRAALRANSIAFGTQVEYGGPMALAADIGTYRNVQARGGLTVELTKGAVEPYVSATFVHDFVDHPAVFEGNFNGGVNAPAAFALAGTDHDWGEVAGGLTFKTGNVDLSLSAQTNIDRTDVSMQSYRGSVTVHF
jgi:hypothetical protein